MTELSETRNAFDALCSLASSENWCWKIHCSTCGHLLFRCGLQELARGRHPDSEQWRVAGRQSVLFRGGNPRELTPEPALWVPWPLDLQERLVQVLAEANVGTISATCGYPDWLGYLGLGLKYTEEAERVTRLVSKSWVPQLLALMPVNAYSRSYLLGLLQDRAPPLSWQALSQLEADLQPTNMGG